MTCIQRMNARLEQGEEVLLKDEAWCAGCKGTWGGIWGKDIQGELTLKQLRENNPCTDKREWK